MARKRPTPPTRAKRKPGEAKPEAEETRTRPPEELNSTERHVLRVLFDETRGDVAEASQAELAEECGLDPRTLPRVLARLRDVGWFSITLRGPRPSLIRWCRHEGAPLASAECWSPPRPRAVPAISDAPRISDVSNPLRYENAALQYVQAEFSAEIRAVEAARAEWSRTHPKVPPSFHAIPFDVAPKVAELVVRIQVNHAIDVDEAARLFIKAWAQIEGRLHWKTGVGFNREEGWDLKYIGHDLGKIHAKLWRAQPSRPIVETPPADAPAMSRDEIAEQSSEFLRAAVGGS